MNRLLFMAIALAGWILFTAINRGFFFGKLLAMPGNISNGINNSSETAIAQNADLIIINDPLQDQLKSELYSSISTGMSYAEVSSILGWEGILIYESSISDREEVIQTKVYRWNFDDLGLDNIAPDKPIGKKNTDPGENIILEFQNDILIELNFSEQNLY
ncbi:MAG: hypothetical protein AAFO95_07680 [Cyanobacteria bacterium J06600_6]